MEESELIAELHEIRSLAREGKDLLGSQARAKHQNIADRLLILIEILTA